MPFQDIQKKKSYAEGDRRVRKIEDRPDPEIEKIDDGSHPGPVEPISHGTAQNQPDPPLIHPAAGVGAEAQINEHPNAHRHRDEKKLVESLKKSEGDSLIFNQRQMKEGAQDGPARAGDKVF